MNEQLDIKVEKLRPFTRLLMTIGELPTSYLMSMTYLEQITWFCNYLQKTVIPVVNNNAQAVEEVQNLVSELQYEIEHLDLQDEVNTKLDEMAESGELADIIAQYLDLKGVLAYNTINEMASAENITNGSICYCLGKDSYNDGYGSFYKIRQITSGDTIDGFNIVRITNDNTIIGERIESNIKESVDTIEANLNNNKNLLLNEDYCLFIGDSYANGYTPDGNVSSWCDLLASRLGIGNRYYKYASNGAGFVATGSGGLTFLQVLQNNISNITNKDKVKIIVVAGGYNDANYNSSYSDITSAIYSFSSYCTSQFPNAKLYIGCVGYNSNKNDSGGSIRDKLVRDIIPAYMSTPDLTNPPLYINFSHLILHNTDLFSSDGFHPNEMGQKQIANKICTFLNSGSINFSLWISNLTIDLTESGGHVNGTDTTQLWDNELSIINDKARFWIQTNVNLNFVPAISIVGNQNFVLGTYITKYLRPSKNTSMQMPVKVLVVSSTQGNNLRDGLLIFATDGKVYLQIKQLNSSGSWETISNVTQLSFYPRNVYFEREYN